MIKINFLGDIEAPRNDYPIQIGVAVIVLVCVLGGCLLLQSAVNDDIIHMTEAKGDLEIELTRLRKITAEVKNLEKKRKDLESKLAVIAKLKGGKLGPVMALDDLNLSIPEKAWLMEIRETQGAYRITGLALDNQTIAGFMKKLEESVFFKDIELIESKQTEKQGVKIKDFSISSTVDYTGDITEKTEKSDSVNPPAPKEGT